MKLMQILLVEDHPIAQKMASTVLESLNCQVDVAGDGETALSKVQNKIYDLIFMDIGLPDIDGHTVARKIREYEKNTRHILIVALTANTDDEERAKVMASGMDDFYAKPLTPQIAQQILSKYFISAIT